MWLQAVTTTSSSTSSSDVLGIPVEIAAVLVTAIFAATGFLLKRLFFRDGPMPSNGPAPLGKRALATRLAGAADAYVKVVSTPQTTSRPAEKAAEKLRAAAEAAGDSWPKAAKVASSLAVEGSPAEAKALLVELKQALT